MRKRFSKLLITGGAGFIGSEFVRKVARKKYRICVVDKLTYAGDLRRSILLQNPMLTEA